MTTRRRGSESACTCGCRAHPIEPSKTTSQRTSNDEGKAWEGPPGADAHRDCTWRRRRGSTRSHAPPRHGRHPGTDLCPRGSPRSRGTSPDPGGTHLDSAARLIMARRILLVRPLSRLSPLSPFSPARLSERTLHCGGPTSAAPGTDGAAPMLTQRPMAPQSRSGGPASADGVHDAASGRPSGLAGAAHERVRVRRRLYEGQERPRCNGLPSDLGPPKNSRSYDECTNDADCTTGGVCVCRVGGSYAANLCMNSGCRVDVDCGQEYCSPSLVGYTSGCSLRSGNTSIAVPPGSVGFFADGPADESRTTLNCSEAPGAGDPRCVFMPDAGRWQCFGLSCLGGTP